MRLITRLIVLALILGYTCSGISAQSLYYPPINDTAWERVNIEALGWSPNGVDSLVTYADRTLSKALIVLVGGRIAVEWYADGRTAASPWYWASAGKTLTAALVGVLQQEGKLTVQDPSTTYLGRGWTQLPPDQEDRITIWHQLTMTSGLDDRVADPYCTEPACLQFKADPGTRWAYHNAPYTLLDRVIENASGETFQSVLKRALLDKTGMNGRFIASGYNNVMWSTPRSMARFGLLAQRGFVWNGSAILTDTAFVRALTRPSQQLNPAYGYLWWLNGQTSFKLPGLQVDIPGPIMPDAPPDAFNALGKNNQILSISPSMDIVLVRMGENPDSLLGGPDVATTQANELWRLLRAAMVPSHVSDHVYDLVLQGRTITAHPTGIECYVISSVTGEHMASGRGNATTVELPELPLGLYFITVWQEGRPTVLQWRNTQ